MENIINKYRACLWNKTPPSKIHKQVQTADQIINKLTYEVALSTNSAHLGFSSYVNRDCT